MRPGAWKVGELARRTGLSVRTLHYYDEIGLLNPSGHTESGHRLYTAADVARLQQVVSLRQLGLSLEEIRDCLGRADFSPLRVVELHLARLREQISLQQRLCARLDALAAALRGADEVSAETFLEMIEGMSMLEKYYTPEQMEELNERRKAVGEERIRRGEAEWQELMGQVRAAMDAGLDPASEPGREPARRWAGLVREFTGGNPGIEKSLRNMYEQEESIHGMATGPVREMVEYLSTAMKAEKGGQ